MWSSPADSDYLFLASSPAPPLAHPHHDGCHHEWQITPRTSGVPSGGVAHASACQCHAAMTVLLSVALKPKPWCSPVMATPNPRERSFLKALCTRARGREREREDGHGGRRIRTTRRHTEERYVMCREGQREGELVDTHTYM